MVKQQHGFSSFKPSSWWESTVAVLFRIGISKLFTSHSCRTQRNMLKPMGKIANDINFPRTKITKIDSISNSTKFPPMIYAKECSWTLQSMWKDCAWVARWWILNEWHFSDGLKIVFGQSYSQTGIFCPSEALEHKLLCQILRTFTILG